MDNDRARQLVHVARKTSLVGEGLQEQPEAQAGRACLVRQELQFIRQKRPMLG
jgi:hypothetical protein